MNRITRTVLATAALVVALAATAGAGGAWQGTLTVVGNGADPGSVSAQGRNFAMAYCGFGQPIGTARVVANTSGTVSVAVSPSSGACASTTLPNGTYDIRWEPGVWDQGDPGINECGGTTDIGDITVVNGSGGPTTSNSFNPGDPGTIQICVTRGVYGMQVPVSVVAAAPPTPPDECPPDSPRVGAQIPNLSAEVFGRIMSAHGFDTAQSGDGRFGPDIDTEEDLMDLIWRTFCYGAEELNSNGSGGYVYILNFPSSIGENGAGTVSRRLFLSVGNGAVVTAYPI